MGKRNCVNPGWNTIQADTGFFHFTGESTFSVTFNSSFHPDHKPTVTLSQAVSGSEIEYPNSNPKTASSDKKLSTTSNCFCF